MADAKPKTKPKAKRKTKPKAKPAAAPAASAESAAGSSPAAAVDDLGEDMHGHLRRAEQERHAAQTHDEA